MEPFPNRSRGLFFAGLTALMWAVLAIVLKVALVSASSGTIVWFRLVFAFSSLCVFFLWRDRSSFRIYQKSGWLIPCAALLLTLNYYGYMKCIQYTGPSYTQIFIQIAQLCFAIGGFVYFKEPLRPLSLIGFAIATFGFVSFYQDQVAQSDSAGVLNSGTMWVVVAAFAWGIYAIILKDLQKKWGPQQLNLMIYSIAMIVLIPLVEFSDFNHLGWKDWGILVFLGANTLIAYGAFGEALRHLPANEVSILLTMNPILTIIIMAGLTRSHVTWIPPEHLGPKGILGAMCVLGGAIFVVARRGKYKVRS